MLRDGNQSVSLAHAPNEACKGERQCCVTCWRLSSATTSAPGKPRLSVRASGFFPVYRVLTAERAGISLIARTLCSGFRDMPAA